MSRFRFAVAMAVLLALAAGCTHAAKSTASSVPAAETDPAPVPEPTARAAASGGWTTYGGSSSRSGIAPGAPAHPRLRRRFARALDGQVYAQPLVAGGRIYVATENNTVYAFRTSGRLVWKRHLGAPVDGSRLPCGNIDPSGITGTPVITAGRIYAVTYLANGHRHQLVGLRLADGYVAVRANVDPANRTVHQERGALLAAHGRIYVPFGGLAGDCGSYHGVVISRTTTGGGRISYVNRAALAGIWSPAGAAIQSGTLLVSVGNGAGNQPGYENAVIRLTPRLKRRGFWAPTDWRPLSAGDVDESSLSPLPLASGGVFQIGKDGIAYLLRHSLGGIGGQQYRAQLCNDGGAFGASGYRAPLVVTPCGGGFFGLRVQGGRFTVAWRNGADGRSVVFAGDSVFTMTREGRLVQIRARDGRTVGVANVGGGATSFPSAAAAGHTLVASAGRAIVVFSI